MLNHIVKAKSIISKKHNPKFHLSFLSLSLLAALSISNPAYADCEMDTSNPDKTVFTCSGENTMTDLVAKAQTKKVVIYNTGTLWSGDDNIEIIGKSIELISTGGKLESTQGLIFQFTNEEDTLTLSGTEIPMMTLRGVDDVAVLSRIKKDSAISLYGDRYDSYDRDNHFDAPTRKRGRNTLNLEQDLKNADIQGWDVINLGKKSKATLTPYFRIGSHPRSGNTQLNIGPYGTFAPTMEMTDMIFDVTNEGNIDLSNATRKWLGLGFPPYSRLHILGNYEGKPGSKILLESPYNPDLVTFIAIEGKATGESEIVMKNNILDDSTLAKFTEDGLLETPVLIDNYPRAHPEDEDWEDMLNDPKLQGGAIAFVGTSQTEGPREAQLIKKLSRYHWSLKVDGKDIISKPVVGYLQQPYINQQMMQEQLGKLHERIANLDNGLDEKQVWVRTNYDSTQLEGQERFGANVKSGFIQIGGDIALSQSQDTQQRTGLMFTYGWANSTFSDKYKAKNGKISADKFTGKARADMLSIGGYHTYYGKNGFYVDSVAQLSWLQNSYDSFDTKVKQNAWGLGASVEVGKAFPILNPKLAIEPQAQLTYQRIWFSGFTDGVKQVQQHSQDRLTARLGGRLIWTENINNKASQLYFSANLIQLLKGEETSIQVGRESISESYGKLAAEFGIGGEYPITPNLSLYANMRYAMGLQSSGSKSYKGNIGLNYRF